MNNVDAEEIYKFEEIASKWWDTTGEFAPLHEINPLRLSFIQSHISLTHKKVLDIGCGGGILSEAMASQQAKVTAIDMAEASLSVARLHLLESQLEVDYQLSTAEAFAQTQAEQFDVISCMEMLEHVPNPKSVIQASAQLVKPGGKIFFSTLNRNLKSYALAIIGAEYLLNLIPKGTHDYQQFIRPSELAQWARAADLELTEFTGLHYNPIFRHYTLATNVDVNYIACFTKDSH